MLNLDESAPPLMLYDILRFIASGVATCGINRTNTVFGKTGAAAAGEGWRNLAHIEHRHCYAAGRQVGITAFLGLYDDVVNVVAACIGFWFQNRGLLLKLTTPLVLLMLNLAESAPPLIL